MMPSEVEQGRRRWFAADECLLAIDEPGDDVDTGIRAISDAILLGAHDELLSAVHRFTGLDHDWAPVQLVDERSLTHTISRPDTAEQGSQVLGLVLNDEVLGRLESIDLAVFEDVLIEPHAVTSRLQLDALSLSADEASRVVPGSLLLLPASFQENWVASLECGPESESAEMTGRRSPDNDGASTSEKHGNSNSNSTSTSTSNGSSPAKRDSARRASVFVQPGSGLVYFRHWEEGGDASESDAAPTKVGSPDVRCLVYLQTTLPLALGEWIEAEPSDGTCTMTDGFRQATLRVRLEDREHTATLMPIGDGYAALIGDRAWT